MTEYAFDHLHFKSSDVEAMAKFLIDSFGAKEISRGTLANAPTIRVSLAGQTLAIIGKLPNETVEGDSSQRRYGLDHWGLAVKDLDAVCEELKAKGVQFAQPPAAIGSVKYAFVLGPDNIRIELIQRD